MEKLKEDWKKVKLGEIIYYKKGNAFKSKDYTEKGIAIVRVSNFTSNSIEIEGCMKISEENKKIYKEYELLEDDIIIATVGSWEMNPNSVVGKVVRVPHKANGTLLNQNAVRMRAKEDVNQKYLYYKLKTQEFQSFVIGGAQGSASQASITLNSIFNFEFNLPPFSEQKEIASILSSLDDKIELNNEMNKTLEEMAQTLFKQWFVDFEFPNENGEPYKSSGGKMVESEFGLIPEGWEVKNLDEIANMYNGYSYKGSELQKSKDGLLTIKNFDRNGGFKINGYKELKSEKVKENHYAEIGDVIVSHTDLTQNAEIIGNPIIILSKDKYEKIIVSMDCVKVVSKHIEISGYLLYLFLKDKRFKNHALGYVSGTTVLHLKKEALPKYKIAVPINKILESFSFLVENIKNKMVVQYNETERLIETRNLILPKLMSGKLEG